MSNLKNIKKNKWVLDFGKSRDKHALQQYTNDALSSLGYTEKPISSEVVQSEVDTNLFVKRSWDIALGPLKQIPMNLFLMYMSGNTISIFPIMMVGMMCLRPIQAFFSLQSTFSKLEHGPSIFQKFMYLFGLFVNMALALYKCSSMGILPQHQSDWLGFMDIPRRVEYSGGGFSYL